MTGTAKPVDAAMRLAYGTSVKSLLAVSLCAALIVACSQPAAAPQAPAGAATTLAQCPAAPASNAPLEEPQLLIQDGHTQLINMLALSGDGSLLASAAQDQTLRLWDTESGLLLARIRAPKAVDGLALDRAGSRLAYFHGEVAGRPRAVRVLRLADEHSVDLPAGPFALSAEGSTIAIGTDPIEVFDTETGERRQSMSTEITGEVHAVALSTDGQRLAAAIDATVAVYDLATGDLERADELSPEPLPPMTPANAAAVMNEVYEVAFVGRQVLATRGTRRLQLVAPDGVVRTLDVPRAQSAVTADTLWTAPPGGELRRFALPSGKPVATHAITQEPFRLTASADGRTVALAQFDPIRGSNIQLLDGASGHLIRTIEGRDTGVLALAMTADGKTLAAGSQAAISLWTLPSGELWFTTPERRLRATRALSFDEGGRRLASMEANRIRVREAATGRLLRSFRVRTLDVALLAFRPGTRRLIQVGKEGDIVEYDLSGPLPEPSTLDADNLIRDLRRPASRRVGSLGFRVDRAALSPDGSLVVAAAESFDGQPDLGRLALFDLETGTERWSVTSPTSFRHFVGFSADGRRVLLSGRRYLPGSEMKPKQTTDAVLRAFSSETGELEIEAHPGTAGPLAARGGHVLVGGLSPVIVDAASLATTARIALRDGYAGAALAHPTEPAFLVGGVGGSTALVSTGGALQALLVATPGGDYVATTPAGAYRASLDGARQLAWTFRKPLEAFSFEQFASQFERPDVLAHRLATRPTPELPRVTRPPRIELDGPRRRRTDRTSTAIRASVRSRRQVDRVRVFANGRLAAEELVCAPQGEVTLDVPLTPGDSRLAVIAYDSEGFASHAELVDVTSTAPGPRPELWIVTIGVSRYPALAPRYQLEFADDDALAMAAALERLAGPDRPFSKARRVTLVDDQVTVESIERALTDLRTMKPHDLAVVFLAGHGLRLADGKMRFLTHRASLKRSEMARSAIGWDRLEKALAQASGRVLLLLDACHSGHVTTEPVAPNEALAQALAADDRTGILIFAASRGAQLSYEVGGGGGPGSRGLDLAWHGSAPPQPTAGLAERHGLFTSAMLEALAGQAPDRDRSGAAELGEIIDYVTERVRSASNGQQTPWVARRELFGDFPLR